MGEEEVREIVRCERQLDPVGGELLFLHKDASGVHQDVESIVVGQASTRRSRQAANPISTTA